MSNKDNMCAGKPLARGTAVTLPAGTARLVLSAQMLDVEVGKSAGPGPC
jgi:hypothetical protein